jgi:hypothetical protein
VNPNDAKETDKADMGKPFGKASACLRVAASAKAGANLYTKRHAPSFNKLEFTKGEVLRLHKNLKTTAFRSLEGRFAHVRYATVR